MSSIKLRGARALSEFRIAKLLPALQAIHPGIRRLAAEYWHFAETEAPLAGTEHDILSRLLQYGAPPDRMPAGARFLVVPRIGTISPWSSKATEIARICGLERVRRIERGTLYALDAELGTDARARVAALLHDRMKIGRAHV